jgi:hypothetical protein
MVPSSLTSAGIAVAVALLAVAATVDAIRASPETPVAAQAGAAPSDSLHDVLSASGIRGVLVYADSGCRINALRLPALTQVQGRTFAEARCGPDQAPDPSDETVPLADGRHAAIVYGPSYNSVGIFRGRRLLYRLLDGFEPLEGLRASASGRYLVVRSDGIPQIVRVGARPRSIILPTGITTEHAVAFSPDERWLAVATRASVYLMRVEAPGAGVIRLPHAVRDLAWRPD